MPFEELSHTADWSARVWADSLPKLFIESALAMNRLAGILPAADSTVHREISLSASDGESLLVAFLSEVLYLSEQEHLVFQQFDLHLEEQGDCLNLECGLTGSSIAKIEKAIKAVTYHNLHILHTPEGWETTLVFDV